MHLKGPKVWVGLTVPTKGSKLSALISNATAVGGLNNTDKVSVSPHLVVSLSGAAHGHARLARTVPRADRKKCNEELRCGDLKKLERTGEAKFLLLPLRWRNHQPVGASAEHDRVSLGIFSIR